MTENTTLKEAKRLYDLGFGILWIKPKSKAPVKSKWTTGPRESWDTLKASYKLGYNLGVRLGSPSKIGSLYLAVIDIDVKSSDSRHQSEALNAVKTLFPDIGNTPHVLSGRGNGSSHLYIGTKEPTKPQRLKVSNDKVKVKMPSSPVNQTQKELLSEEDLNEGYRMRPAWEIAVMGEGQQVVLPPSTHPDTGHAYTWKTRIELDSDLQEIRLSGKKKEDERSLTNDWKPIDVDLVLSPLDKDVIDLILYAECEDRSATLFKVVIAMIKEGMSDQAIMSVLTDPNYELSKTAYDHAKTDLRSRAANWLFNYTIKKARNETDACLQFNEEVEVSYLDDEQAEKQIIELGNQDWRMDLERYGPKGLNANKPKKSLRNLILILENEISPCIFKRNLFSNIDAYGTSAPWGGWIDKSITDDDLIQIKYWVSNRYRFEPDLGLICEVISAIALKNSSHPVREYVQKHEWDGVKRVDEWMKKYINAKGPEPYLSDVSRKILIAMITRVFNPGCKFDFIPVLEGAQGIGKSSAARILASDDWFADNLPDLRSADARLNLQGKWIVEMAELANLKMGELETIKAYIASQSDRVRAPYGRKAMDLKRQSIFIGTTNESTYLKDKTGNRRYWPVTVGQCDFRGLEAVRDQLFAEAYFIYTLGEDLWLSGSSSHQAVSEQLERVGEDEETIMLEQLEKFIVEEGQKHQTERFDFESFKMLDLFEGLSPFSRFEPDQKHLQMVGRVLIAAGFEKYVVQGKSRWRQKGRGVDLN